MFLKNKQKNVSFYVRQILHFWFLLSVLLLLPDCSIAQQAARKEDHVDNNTPTAPTNPSAAARSASHAVLAWTDNADNESGFKIERRKTNGGDTWQYVGRTSANVTTFESVGLLGQVTYDHRIYAYNDIGNSPRVAVPPVTMQDIPAQSLGMIIVPATTEIVRNGEGTFVKLKNNNLMLIYSAFTGVSDLALSKIAAKISPDGGRTWSTELIIFSDPKISLLLPSVIRMGNGELGLGYSKLLSGTQAVKVFRYSKDEGQTWSDELPLSDNAMPYMTGSHDRFIKLTNNRLLNFVHGKMPGINVGTHLGTHIFASDDNGRTWIRKTTQPLQVPYNPFDKGEYGFWEVTGAETSPNEIYLLGRTSMGWLYESISNDGGDSWSVPKQSNLLNPISPARLEKIPGTNTLVVIRNPYMNMSERLGGNRFILSSQTSEDGGLTWKNYQEIFYDKSDNWFDYPAVFWDKDTLHLTCREVALDFKGDWKSVDIRYIALKKTELIQPKTNNSIVKMEK